MIGKQLGRYRIVAKIGAGGMGEVYLAEDTDLLRQIAIKVISPRLAADPGALANFKREAQAVAALNHPHIVTIHSVEEADGVHFMTMEHVDGKPLADLIRKQALPLAELLEIAIPLFDAVGAAHQRGIAHRDLKPGNIVITQDGRVKVLDFGLAKLLEHESGTTPHLAATRTLTEPGTVVGTAAYMSPEQAEGKSVDQRSDIFSLGVILFEMATGRRPFAGDSQAALLSSILRDEPPPLTELRPDLPAGFNRIVRLCLVKNPADRFKTASDVRIQLQDLKAELTAQRISGRAPQRPAGRRWLRRTLTLGLVGAAVVAGGYLAVDRLRSPDDRAASLAVAPDSAFVVAITPFWGSNEEAIAEGKVMQALVEQELRERIDGDESILILGKELEETPNSPDEARAYGERLGATAVVWGEVLVLRGEIDIRPTITMTLPDEAGPLGENVISAAVIDRNESARALEARLDSPDQLRLRKTKAAETSNLVLLRAGKYYDSRDPDRALVLLRKIDPPSSRSLVSEAGILLAREELRPAEALLQRAVRLDSTWAEPYLELGWIHRRDDPELAKREYDRAIALEPDSAEPHRALGLAHYSAWGEDSMALREFRTAIALDPRDSGAYHWLGHVLADMDDVEGSAEAFLKACELVPGSSRSHVCMATMYSNHERFDDALDQFKVALDIDPEVASAHAGMAIAYRRSSRLEEALTGYRAAIALDTSDGSLQVGLARTYLLKGDFADAVTAAKKAVALDPEGTGSNLVYTLSLLRNHELRAARDHAAGFTQDLESEAWATLFLRYYAGLLDEDAVWAATRESSSEAETEHRCEAFYYLGVAQLVGLNSSEPDTTQALDHFSQCIDIGASRFVEYEMARAELARMPGRGD